MSREIKVKLKLGDVYNFVWKKEEYDKQSWRGSLDHCFEGLLVVMNYPQWNEKKDKYEDEIRLVDTFWGINITDNNKSFTLKEAQEKGNLEFYCNLNDIEKVEKYDLDKYDDNDLFMLHDQHYCSKYYYKRKGAKKSPTKRISVIEKEIKGIKDNIEYEIRQIEWLSTEKENIKIKGLE